MPSIFDSDLNRRQVLKGLGVAGLGAFAAACAGPGSGSKKPAATTSSAVATGSASASIAPGSASAQPVTGHLSFAHWRAEDKAVFQQIIDNFVKANPGAQVRQDITDSNDYNNSEIQRLKTGSIGDVFAVFRGAQFDQAVEAALLTDLTSLSASKNYLQTFSALGQSKSKQLGLPYIVNFNMPIYNVDLFEAAGASEPPGDWDSFLALLDALKGKGKVPIIFPLADPADANQLIGSMVMNNAPSEDMFAKIESGEYKCTDDWFLNSLKQYAQLRPYIQANATGTQAEAAQQLFAQGTGAIMITGSYEIGPIRTLNAKFGIDVFSPITVSKDKVKFEGVYNATFLLAISTLTKELETAQAFVNYLSTPENAGIYANGTANLSPVDGVQYTNADLKTVAPWLKRKLILAPQFQFINQSINTAVLNAATQVVGGKSPEQAAASAQQIVDQQRRV